MLRFRTWMQLCIDLGQYSLRHIKLWSTRTEDLISHIVLPDEVAQELLVHAGCVDDLRDLSVHVDTEKRMQSSLTAVSQNVQPSSSAFRSTGSACSRVSLLPRPKLMPMAPKPGTGTCMSPNF
jgi:hypothetical protein